MDTLEILSNEAHKEVRVSVDFSGGFASDLSSCPVVPHEFRNIQHHFPIFFKKLEGGDEYTPIALLGLEPEENLFIKDDKWDCRYEPLFLSTKPFIVGVENKEADSGKVLIDTKSPRLAADSSGEAIFDDEGAETEFLKDTVKKLELMHSSGRSGEEFVAWLNKFDLLEPFALEVKLEDGSNNRLVGLYTINEQKVAALEPGAVSEMVDRGFMMATFMVMASMASIADLVDRKNQK